MDSPRDILKRHGLRAKHSWGQNFLSDERVLAQIADAVDLTPNEAVIELGPGLGHLTAALLETGARVTAVERDRDMLKVLGEMKAPNLTVVAGNATEIQFAEVANAESVAVVGNLPYHLTSPILFEVLAQRSRISRAVFTVQKEVADRVASPPGSRNYGLLSVLLGLHFKIEKILDLPAAMFHPPPKVDSAVIRMLRREAPAAPVADADHFTRVVKACFAQRRKTLWNSLRKDPELADDAIFKAALEEARIDPQRRAETLAVEEFAALERALWMRNPIGKKS